MAKTSAEDRARAIEIVKRLAPEGTRVGYMVTKWNPSGASRRVAFIVHTPDCGFFRLDMALARAAGYRVPKDGGGVLCTGGGMDTGAEAIENLSRAVYGRPDALKADRL